MGKCKDLTEVTRGQVKILKETGKSYRFISKKLGISLSSVSKTLSRIEETKGYSSRKRSGHPRITSKQTDRVIHRYALMNPFASSSEIRSHLPINVTKPCSSTVRKRLANEFNLKTYRPARTPLFTSKNVKDRLAFCHRYSTWTAQDWCSVTFSDETTISQFHSNRPFVRRPKNRRFNPLYTIPTVRSTPTVMIWGAISASGPCGLHFVPEGETINGERYLKIIQEKIPSFMENRNTNIFQQDGAPPHRAKIVTSWLNAANIQTLQNWPGNSPDLNPIENCWVQVKKKVQEKLPGSIVDLRSAITEVWTREITANYCRKLVESMPRRIQACMRNKGKSTKY